MIVGLNPLSFISFDRSTKDHSDSLVLEWVTSWLQDLKVDPGGMTRCTQSS
jgi:hypothetical protein